MPRRLYHKYCHRCTREHMPHLGNSLHASEAFCHILNEVVIIDEVLLYQMSFQAHTSGSPRKQGLDCIEVNRKNTSRGSVLRYSLSHCRKDEYESIERLASIIVSISISNNNIISYLYYTSSTIIIVLLLCHG